MTGTRLVRGEIRPQGPLILSQSCRPRLLIPTQVGGRSDCPQGGKRGKLTDEPPTSLFSQLKAHESTSGLPLEDPSRQLPVFQGRVRAWESTWMMVVETKEGMVSTITKSE